MSLNASTEIVKEYQTLVLEADVCGQEINIQLKALLHFALILFLFVGKFIVT